MATENNFTGWTDEQLRQYVLSGEEPTTTPAPTPAAAPVPATPVVNAPPGQFSAALQQRNAEATARDPVGSFTEGFSKQIASPGLGIMSIAGVPGAKDAAKMHGEEMRGVRSTPMGELGSIAANTVLGGLALPARGALASMGAGAALEGAQDLGEGKSGVEGVGRGAVGGLLGNWLAAAAGTAANTAAGKLGVQGRWGDNATEEVYNFAKSKGVDLRPGDLPGRSVHRGVENMHYGALGTSGLENQSAQLYSALFGRGDKNEILAGFQRVDDAVRHARNQVWGILDQIPDKTTVTPTGLISALENARTEYPKVLNSIENDRLKQKLKGMLQLKQELLDQGYSQTSAHRMAASANEMTFDEVREVLKKVINPQQVKASQKAAEKKASPYVADEINSIKDAINGDLKRWGVQNPDKYDAYKKVLEIHNTGVLPYEQNPIIMKWKAKAYDKSPETLIRDLMDETQKSARNNLIRDYIAPTDKDTLNYLRMLELADRGAAVIAGKGAGDQVLPASLLSPLYTAARVAVHQGAGKPWMTPISGASSRVFSPRAGALTNIAEGALKGEATLGWDDMKKNNWGPKP